MWSTIYQEETMTPEIKAQTAQDLQGWPNHWPPPCKFLGPLIFNITSLNFRSSLTEHQAIIRFKNQYGVRISENLFHEGLFLVAILKFYGPNDGDYDLVHDSSFPDLTWYFTGHEVFSFSEKVAQWERPPGHTKTGPAK
jgi:hypothetical protein